MDAVGWSVPSAKEDNEDSEPSDFWTWFKEYYGIGFPDSDASGSFAEFHQGWLSSIPDKPWYEMGYQVWTARALKPDPNFPVPPYEDSSGIKIKPGECDDPFGPLPACKIKLFCGDIPLLGLGALGIVHCWIEVEHCDGTFTRYDKWQFDREFSILVDEPEPSTPLTDEPGDAEEEDESNVMLNMFSAGAWTKPPKDPEKTWEFPCEGDCSNMKDPGPCQALTPEEVSKIPLADFYFVLWPNSNSFTQTLLNHAGLPDDGGDPCDLPMGAVGDIGHGGF